MKKRLGFDLILLGDPASGKDTQALGLMKDYNLKAVESGKQWRIMVKKNDFRGRWLKRTFGIGKPAPVAIVKWFLNNKVKNIPKGSNLIFIGNPRLKPEAQFLVKLLKKQNRDFYAIYIKISAKEIFRRSLSRVRMTGEDEKKYVQTRIDWHNNQVNKTVQYLKKLGKMKIINGKQDIKKVAKDIQNALNDYQRSERN